MYWRFHNFVENTNPHCGTHMQNLNTSKKQPVCILAKLIGEDGQIIDDSNPLQPCAGIG